MENYDFHKGLFWSPAYLGLRLCYEKNTVSYERRFDEFINCRHEHQLLNLSSINLGY